MKILEIIDNFFQDNNYKKKIISVYGFDIAYLVNSENLLQILKFIKENDKLRFTILNDLFVVDFPKNDKRFEIVYNLLSLKLNKRMLLKILLNENDNITSIKCLYSSAFWYEREAFDMFGINDNSNDLSRILTDYNFKGHPLRKDFPLSGDVQIKYDEKLRRIINEQVVLDQEFRNFQFESPWRGAKNDILPGDEKAKF